MKSRFYMQYFCLLYTAHKHFVAINVASVLNGLNYA